MVPLGSPEYLRKLCMLYVWKYCTYFRVIRYQGEMHLHAWKIYDSMYYENLSFNDSCSTCGRFSDST